MVIYSLMLNARAIEPCAREVRVYGVDRIANPVLLRVWPVSAHTLIIVDRRFLTSRIRSPTLAAFSFITLTRLRQYHHQHNGMTETHRFVVAFFKARETSLEWRLFNLIPAYVDHVISVLWLARIFCTVRTPNFCTLDAQKNWSLE